MLYEGTSREEEFARDIKNALIDVTIAVSARSRDAIAAASGSPNRSSPFERRR
jgi:hypothetical protein